MKTITHFFNTSKNKNHLWKGLNSFLNAQLQSSELWQLRHLSPGAYSSLAQKIKSLSLWIKMTAVVRDATSGLTALLSSTATNTRILVGLVLVGVVTPLSACTHLLFDRSVEISGWYHVNNFYLFMLLGPYLAGFFLTIGVFFLFPKDAARAYILVVPMAYLIGKIMWLYSTTSNTDYWAVPHWSFFAIGACISMVIFISMEWLTWRFFHRDLAFKSRYSTIANGRKVLSLEEIGKSFLETYDAEQEFKKQY